MEISRLQRLFTHGTIEAPLLICDGGEQYEGALRLEHKDVFSPEVIRGWFGVMQDEKDKAKAARLLCVCNLEASEGLPFPVKTLDLITLEEIALKIYEPLMKYRGFAPAEIELIRCAEVYAKSSFWFTPPFSEKTIEEANELIERKRREHDRTQTTH